MLDATEEEMNIVNSIISGEQPQEEQEEQSQEEQQEVVEEAPQQEVIEEQTQEQQEPQPQEAMENVAPQTELLKKLVENQAALQETVSNQQEMLTSKQQSEQNEQPLTDEEMAIQELRGKLGIDAIMQENEQLKAQLEEVYKYKEEQQKQSELAQQQQAMQQQIIEEVEKFEKNYPNANADAIMNYIEKQPQGLRENLDNYDGWVMIHNMLEAQAQPQEKPDPVVSTSNNVSQVKKDTKNMTQQEADIEKVSEILSMLS